MLLLKEISYYVAIIAHSIETCVGFRYKERKDFPSAIAKMIVTIVFFPRKIHLSKLLEKCTYRK